MSEYVLVHLNVVRPVGPFAADHPNAVYFFTQLPEVFSAARADGDLHWHHHGVRTRKGRYVDMRDMMALRTKGTEENFHILTMAGWRDAKALHRFAYREPLHRDGMLHLKDWVDRSEGPTMVLWWSPAGQRVALEDGWDRLARLRRDGPSAESFSLQNRFPPPD